VLVIEDNVDAAETLRDVLRLAGHEAEVAFDGREALEKLAGVQPDTILCDLGLPDMDGFELARRLRREPSGRDVMLVALSGYARPEDRERSREAGFDAHLAKPASEEALEALLRDGVPRRTEERGGAA
jgi:CheY-like chemotaxis protein